MKGIILAGGTGSRLYPITYGTCKQLLPVYDKPLVYYPLTTLMLAGIRDILIITNPNDLPLFQNLLGDGNQWGINLEYVIQEKPRGIAEAFIIGEEFIGNDSVALILGDNIFYGEALTKTLQLSKAEENLPTIFGCYVRDPERYCVVMFDSQGKVVDLVEKPNPYETPFDSKYVVPGLYFYPNDVIDIAKTVKPSSRRELEITDINNVYLSQSRLNVKFLGRGTAWMDAGTHDSLLEASNFVSTIEKRQGLKIACPEEIAYRKSWINEETLKNHVVKLNKTEYGLYLKNLLMSSYISD